MIKTPQIRKACVELAKRIVRAEASYTCAHCGRSEPFVRTHGSHIYSEGQHPSMSADIDNILCLCATCHMNGKFNKSTNWSWHGNPVEAFEWFKENYPERYEHLRIRVQKPQYRDRQFWEQRRTELKDRWKDVDLLHQKTIVDDMVPMHSLSTSPAGHDQ